MLKKSVFIVSLVVLISQFSFAETIYVSGKADDLENYAAKELQRYLYHVSGELAQIRDSENFRDSGFILGTLKNGKIRKLVGQIKEPGPQGYLLKTINKDGKTLLVIAANESAGCLYGVYGLLEDHYDIGFYFSGDVFPSQKTHLKIPRINEKRTPATHIRGVLPWTNFPQSATSYSFEDWKYVIDQMARMRMNLLNIHNYFGWFDTEEMFHNFTLDDQMARVWFATAGTGHIWAGQPGWDVNKYKFGAADLFADYDFGSDATLHNENLDKYNTFRKGVSMFQRVINYAHKRGVKMALGIEFGIIPKTYKGMKPEEKRVIEARVDQIIADYPNLDYLICYQFENHEEEAIRLWLESFNHVYGIMKKRAPQIKLAVAGWGLAGEQVSKLPEDVIVAPIAHYSEKFKSGEIYGNREFWGCPWVERDGYTSMYYYTYNMPLQNTMDCWEKRADNLKGFQCLTWRLTDAVDPKIKYIADAPWYDRFEKQKEVYYEYAEENYGKPAAEKVTHIINGNEPYASNWAECQWTPPFEDEPQEKKKILNIKFFSFAGDITPENSIEATSYADKKGTENAPCEEDGKCVGFIDTGDWLKYENIDISKADKFTARIAAIEDGGYIDIHLDDPNSPAIARIEIKNTGGWQKWMNVTKKIKPVKGTHDVYLKFGAKKRSYYELQKARRQIKVLDECIKNAQTAEQKKRLSKVIMRIASARDQIILNRRFKGYKWKDLSGAMRSWIKNFVYRIDDISSLGTVVSTQNRFVQLNYMTKIEEIRERIPERNTMPDMLQPPSNVKVKSTKDGAVITWKNEQLAARGFNVYRNGKKINDQLLPSFVRAFEDKADGSFNYSVNAVVWDDRETLKSIPVPCKAGAGDKEPPEIFVISPHTSTAKGQDIEITARILDDKAYRYISADLYYRRPGKNKWQKTPMKRRVKAVFTADIPTDKYECLEYYVSASDGTNTAVYPVSAPYKTLSTVIYETVKNKAPAKSELKVDGKTIKWNADPENVHWYKIYRSSEKEFKASSDNFVKSMIDGLFGKEKCSVTSDNFVAYLAGVTSEYTDTGLGFDGNKLKGTYYYRITAVDIEGFESKPSNTVKINW